MTDELAAIGMGLTEAQRNARDAVIAHLGQHGAMPSRRELAGLLGCNISNAARTLQRLVERGELLSDTAGGPLSGFGGSGIRVTLPADVAQRLAAFCSAHGERLQAVLADAVMLHLDQVAGPCLEIMAEEIGNV